MQTIGRVSLVTCARGVRLNQSRILLISDNVTVVSDCARGCVWCCVCASVRMHRVWRRVLGRACLPFGCLGRSGEDRNGRLACRWT
jgi:hypothetical protein